MQVRVDIFILYLIHIYGAQSIETYSHSYKSRRVTI